MRNLSEGFFEYFLWLGAESNPGLRMSILIETFDQTAFLG